MSQGDGIDNVSELISCKNRSPELAVPQVDRISDVREFCPVLRTIMSTLWT